MSGLNTRSLPPEVIDWQHGERNFQKDLEMVLVRWFEQCLKYGTNLMPVLGDISAWLWEVEEPTGFKTYKEATAQAESRAYWTRRLHAALLDLIVGMP